MQELQKLQDIQQPSAKILAVALTPDGSLCAAGDRDGFIHIIDVKSGAVLRKLRQQHIEFVYTLAIHPQTGHLFSAGKDKSIREWNIDTGECIKDYAGIFSPGSAHSAGRGLKAATKSHKMTILSIALERDGLMATGSQDTTLKLWKNDDPVRTFDWHTGPVTCVRFQPGTRVLFSASRDKTIRSWNEITGALIHKYTGHLGEIIALEFIDADHFASADVLGNVMLWNAESEHFDHILYKSPERLFCAKCIPSRDALLLGKENGAIEAISLIPHEANATPQAICAATEHACEIRCIDATPSGIIASGDNSGKVVLWNFSH